MATTIVSPSMIRVTFALVVRPVGAKARVEVAVIGVGSVAVSVVVAPSFAVDSGATSAAPSRF
jgi:hypothetical protein